MRILLSIQLIIRAALLPLVMAIFVLLPRGMVLVLFEGNIVPRRRTVPDVATESPRISGVPEYSQAAVGLSSATFVSHE